MLGEAEVARVESGRSRVLANNRAGTLHATVLARLQVLFLEVYLYYVHTGMYVQVHVHRTR